MFSYYDVLGVDRSADHDTIKAAYHRKARQFHPDRLLHTDPDLAAEAEEHMRALNEAWSVLGDADARRRYDQQLDGIREPTRPGDGTEGSASTSIRTPGPFDCVMCGSSPAARVSVRQVTGLLLARRGRQLEATLCRGCGLAAVRALTNRTLWTGWWAITAFFSNFAALAANFAAWRAVRSLGEPRGNEDVAAPLPSPMPTGRPLLARSGVWFVALILLPVVAGVIVNVAQPTATQDEVAVCDWAQELTGALTALNQTTDPATFRQQVELVSAAAYVLGDVARDSGNAELAAAGPAVAHAVESGIRASSVGDAATAQTHATAADSAMTQVATECARLGRPLNY